jgi:hypothetical protein
MRSPLGSSSMTRLTTLGTRQHHVLIEPHMNVLLLDDTRKKLFDDTRKNNFLCSLLVHNSMCCRLASCPQITLTHSTGSHNIERSGVDHGRREINYNLSFVFQTVKGFEVLLLCFVNLVDV